MFHIIYLSSAVNPFTPEQLQALLATSRKNNTALGVTGLLLYKDGNFLQVIEGEKTVVEALYNKIERDPRHRGFMAIFKEPIAKREFADWSMGFRDLDTPPKDFPEGYTDILNTNWSKLDVAKYSAKIRTFMKLFSH